MLQSFTRDIPWVWGQITGSCPQLVSLILSPPTTPKLVFFSFLKDISYSFLLLLPHPVTSPNHPKTLEAQSLTPSSFIGENRQKVGRGAVALASGVAGVGRLTGPDTSHLAAAGAGFSRLNKLLKKFIRLVPAVLTKGVSCSCVFSK